MTPQRRILIFTNSVAAVPPLNHTRNGRNPAEQRARSIPYKRPFVRAIVISAMYFLALIGAIAALFCFFAQPVAHTGIVMAGFATSSLVLWLLGLAARRHAHCPLCRGTPFLDSAAHAHVKAVRFYPLNHGISNLIRAIASQRFRCQFCGTTFDLLKSSARHRLRSEHPRR